MGIGLMQKAFPGPSDGPAIGVQELDGENVRRLGSSERAQNLKRLETAITV